jgi:hypothetical protein
MNEPSKVNLNTVGGKISMVVVIKSKKKTTIPSFYANSGSLIEGKDVF